MLRFSHVNLSYGTQKILRDVSFEIQAGQFAVFIGPSGCGKTTTLKMINRLIQPDSGHVYLGEKDIAVMDRYELRRHTGYVIQQIGLFPNMTVAQNICVVPKLLKWPKAKCDQVVHDLLDREFLGKHQPASDPAGLTVDQFMRTGIITVKENRGVNECVSRMQHHNVDTLLVVDENRRYQGTVSIADIRLTGHVVKTIGPLVRCTTPAVHVGDNAVHTGYTLVCVAIGFVLGVLLGVGLSRLPTLSKYLIPLL